LNAFSEGSTTKNGHRFNLFIDGTPTVAEKLHQTPVRKGRVY
jgi:hypothetical protein